MDFESLHLASLKYFIDTVDSGSFTTAANLNHVSRPAISQAIKRLEAWSGIDLLKHQKNNLELTLDGQHFYRRAKASYQNFQHQFISGAQIDRSLKIGCSASLVDLHLIPTLKILKRKVKLHIQVGTSNHLKNLLEDGRINLAIFVESGGSSRFESEIISEGKFGVFSKSGKLEEPLIVTEERAEVADIRNYLRKQKADLDMIEVESWSLACKLAETMGGSCLIPDFVPNSRLRQVQLKGFQPEYKVLLASRRSDLLSENEVQFCTLLKDR